MDTQLLSPLADLERAEAEALLDFYDAAPDDFVKSDASAFSRLGNSVAIGLPSIPMTEFNRCLEARTIEDLSSAQNWLDAHAKSWAIQIPTPEISNRIQTWLRKNALRPRGNGWAKFHRDARPLAPSAYESRLRVRIAAKEDAELFSRLVREGFNMPPQTAEWFAALVRRPRWNAYLAFDGDVPIASAAMFIHGRTAWLGFGSTLAEHRKKGAQTALVRARVTDGIAMGLQSFSVETGQPDPGKEASHASYSNMRRAGFEQAYVRVNYARLQP
ncbi:GNAT family N-acetyltransferase [Rhizobium sp. BK251]|uniref:GNAT family N-acetyltransferase n=1 Tax=Rhizobium sp. BK251 TaxID=2512125 RepID=UPI0010D024A4|nr:GNAT family N-acetyltransferase [Rhizobium sp. BK251]TCL74480.1 acetyltransferase (GNAT) family protein [Rhizobium sp. BK251]